MVENKKSSQQAYERLYSLKRFPADDLKDDEKNAGFMQKEESEIVNEYTYHPKINKKSAEMVRKQEVSESLYQDALRRNSKFEESQSSKLISTCSVTSVKTNTLLANKLEKEFAVACQETCSDEVSLEYVTMTEILAKMGFISFSEKVESGNISLERNLCHDVWKVLQGEESNGVAKENLLTFVLALMGLQKTIKNVSIDLMQMENNQKSTLFGYFDSENIWHISVTEAKKIKKQFDLLYRNRLANESLGKIRNAESYSFAPAISNNSRNLADNYRKKVAEESSKLLEKDIFFKKNFTENQVITHPDFLIMQKRAQELNLDKKISETREQELRNCTFTPEIHSNAISKNEKVSGKRYEDLYNLRKLNYLSQDRNANEIEFEKNQDHCTFRPDISKSSTPLINQTLSSQYSEREAESKAIERMKKGREERIFVKEMHERGIPQKKNSCKENKSLNSKRCLNEETVPMTKEVEYFKTNVSPMKPDTTNYISKELLQPDNRGSPLSPFSETNSDRKEEEQKIPLLFVDVNIGPNRTERIIVYDGDNAETLAKNFALEHKLDQTMKDRLIIMLEDQISATLCRIEEEISQNSEESAKKRIN